MIAKSFPGTLQERPPEIFALSIDTPGVKKYS